MKKRFPAFFLALALCMGLAVPAFAADTKSITAAGITFDAMVTDRYESTKSIAEGYSWADIYGPEAEFEYYIGGQTVREEGSDVVGLADFHAYLVNDDVTLDFHLKKGEKFSIEGYYLAIVEQNKSWGLEDKLYDATYIDGWTFTAEEDGELIDKAFIDQYYPGANYLFCYRGSYTDFDSSKAVRIVFADENATPRTVAFTDLLPWCDVEALWAAQKGITKGYGGKDKFAPGATCSQEEILTFLWRAEDKRTAQSKSPFTVASYYQDAVDWAYEKGIIGDGFTPGSACTRAQAVTYIWKARNELEAKEAASFTDVDADSPIAPAVSWAVEKGVTKGYGGADTFAPDRVCTRGEIACFLYRAYN